jgi:cell division protein FtsB
MPRGKEKRTAPKQSRKTKNAGCRTGEIQSVFDRLGLGDPASRRQARSNYGVVTPNQVTYRIVLSGSTQA